MSHKRKGQLTVSKEWANIFESSGAESFGKAKEMPGKR